MSDRGPYSGVWRALCLKLAVLLAFVACATYIPYLVLGLWNRMFGGWRSVFYCYAGNSAYTNTYGPGRISNLFRWWPTPIGVLHQAGAWGIVLASSVREADFLDPRNARAFARLQRRIARIARIIGAPEVNLAGILPSVIGQATDLPLRDGRGIVVDAVIAGVERIVAARFSGQWPAVIVLGGGGHIGTPLAQNLRARGAYVTVIDPKLGDARLLPQTGDAPALLIDVARKGVLITYADQLWPGLVVLNETFPRPARRDLARLAERRVEVWHLSGVEGQVIPPLPYGYEGAVPCCAVHEMTKDTPVRVIRLSAPA